MLEDGRGRMRAVMVGYPSDGARENSHRGLAISHCRHPEIAKDRCKFAYLESNWTWWSVLG
jgi:hypothetical protein